MRFALMSLAVVALAVPALGGVDEVLFTDDFDYAAGTELTGGWAPGDSPDGHPWGTKDTGKPNPAPFTADGQGIVVQQGVGQGGQQDTSVVWAEKMDGQVYLHLDVRMDEPGFNCGRFLRDGVPFEWTSNFLQVRESFTGYHEWYLRGDGNVTVGTGVARESGVFEDILLVIDMDTDTFGIYLDKTLADVGSLGAMDASVGQAHAGQGIMGWAFIEWGDAPNWALNEVNAGWVPEPATMALLGLGGLGMLIRKRR